MSELLLFSGGLDSFIAWRLLHAQPFYIELGHRYQDRELAGLERLTTACAQAGLILDVRRVVDRVLLGDQERIDAHIPYRNLLLASLAALDLPSSGGTIYLGALAGEASRDKSARFYRDLSRLLSYTEHSRVHVRAPFKHLTKTELVYEYLKQFPSMSDVTLLAYTTSCYSGTAQRCGNCQACFRRWVAMSLNGIMEVYDQPPALYGRELIKRRTWRSYLPLIDWREWPGILRNNWQAYRAIRLAEQENPHVFC